MYYYDVCQTLMSTWCLIGVRPWCAWQRHHYEVHSFSVL